MRIVLCLLLLCGTAAAQTFSRTIAFRGSFSFQPETLAYNSNIVANGGTISLNDLNAVNTFVVNAKSHGYWTNLLDCSPFAGNQTNAAVVKLITGPNSFTNLQINSLTSADYVKSNGWSTPASGWLNTRFLTANFPVTNEGMSVWFSLPYTNVGTGISPIGHNSNPSGNFEELIFSSSPIDMLGVSLNVNAAPPNNQWRQVPGVGLWGYTRTANNAVYSHQNGYVIWSSSTLADWVVNSQPVSVLGNYNFFAGAPSVFFAQNPIGFYELDNGIPTNKLPSFYADVRAMMKGIGRVAQYPFVQPSYLIIGQSLANGGGNQTNSALIARTNYNSFALASGSIFAPMEFPSTTSAAFTRSRYNENDTINGYNSDFGWSGFADHLFWLCTNGGFGGITNGPLLLDWAHSGQAYSGLKRGGTDTATILGFTTNCYSFSTNDIYNQNQVQSNLYGYGMNLQAILCCHGEADMNNSSYSNNLGQWIGDYQQDICPITGQTNLPPMFMMQNPDINWPVGSSYPYADIAMLTMHEVSAGSNLLVMCRYPLTFDSSFVHLGGRMDYARQGEYFAEAVYKQVIAKTGWDCLRPTNIVRTGAVLTVTMSLPNLVTDVVQVAATANLGFTYTNSLGQNTISTIALVGNNTNQVKITLGADPGQAGTLRYAMNCTNINAVGPIFGARGNLRDQWPNIGFTTTSNLYNWCVMFDKATP